MEAAHDAADSLGYTFRRKLLRAVAPQAVHIALPGHVNAIICLIHNVALVMHIGAADDGDGSSAMQRDYNQYQFETHRARGALFALCLVAWASVRFFERRAGRYASNDRAASAPLLASI